MSDEQLRELDRKWKESGSVEDEATLLLARVRAERTTQRRLELAAALGSPGAVRAATATQGPPPAEPPADLSEEGKAAWLRFQGSLAEEGYFPLDFDSLDREASLRSALAALGPAIEAWAAELPRQLDDTDESMPLPPNTLEMGVSAERRVRSALEACRAYCAQPNPETKANLSKLASRLRQDFSRLQMQGGGEWQDNWLATFLMGMVGAVASTCMAFTSDETPEDGFVSEIIQGALFAWEEQPNELNQLEQGILSAQREDLIPWLLGHGDSVRERVEGQRHKGPQ